MYLLNADKNLWNKLLADTLYIQDEGWSTKQRISISYNWGKAARKALDIGSGQGYLEKKYYSRIRTGKLDWTSVDISEVGLKRIRKLYKVKTTEASVTDLPFDRDHFDCIFCMEVLEHLPKDTVYKAYIEIMRVLVPDGYVILSVPVYEPVALMNHPVGHLRKYTPKIIEDEIKKNGLKILKKHWLYSFERGYIMRSLLSRCTGLRRPSVVMYLCQK